MADCGFPLPCQSTVHSVHDALQITNNGSGGALGITANGAPLRIKSRSGEAITITMEGAEQTGGGGIGPPAILVDTTGVEGGGVSVFTSDDGVGASSDFGAGVVGVSSKNAGVLGDASGEDGGFLSAGVVGNCNPASGAGGVGPNAGVFGNSDKFTGVQGVTNTGIGVVGTAVEDGGTGVVGTAKSGVAIQGDSGGGFISAGVMGTSSGGFISAGVMALNSKDGIGFGLYARGSGGGAAGFLDGDVEVTGSLTKAGGGFKIDHPIEPADKYLSHSFVESPERKNVYDGVVALDDNGTCWVELPGWFEALNGDFRYQLTPIGAPAPNLHVGREISANRFNIAGGTSGMKVSWQVTGIRKDVWAQANPLIAEKEKPESERGYYQHPELFNQPRENSTFWKGNAELIRQLEEPRSVGTQDHRLREQVRYLKEKLRRRREQKQGRSST
jgi:hypothetical protein